MQCDIPGMKPADFPLPEQPLNPADDNGEIVLAGGCFWCTEAVYRALDGVEDVVSGYAGGTADTANYQAVCSGTTDHAEAIRISYDPARVSLGEILRIFFSVAHDPTQLNRQGNDRGRQYRSAIFYASDRQREYAEAYMRQLEQAGAWPDKIVTTLEPLTDFYPAEAYHQDYARVNPRQPYIQAVSMPKVEKFRDSFPDKVRR